VRRAFTVARRALLGAALSIPFGRAAHAAQRRLLAAGTPLETPVHTLRAAAAGPTVLVVAGIHGNETAPPVAAASLLELRLTRGCLVVIPETNRAALAVRTRTSPREKHADLNRNFPRRADDAPRGALATALWSEILAVRPDWVLDLHEGWGFSAVSKSMGSSVVVAPHPGTDASTRPMAERVIAAVGATVRPPGHPFTLIQPGPAGSLARAVVERAATPALVFETTWTQPLQLRVAQQSLMVATVLEALAMT
jgi:predicted deacylase